MISKRNISFWFGFFFGIVSTGININFTELKLEDTEFYGQSVFCIIVSFILIFIHRVITLKDKNKDTP